MSDARLHLTATKTRQPGAAFVCLTGSDMTAGGAAEALNATVHALAERYMR